MITYGQMSIYEAVKKISNTSFVIPAFQRGYVWTTDQVACLWDSILSDYPISTFLFWKISRDYVSVRTSFYKFINDAVFQNVKNKSEHANDAKIVKWQDIPNLESAVLDGQQRLTSLYITLMGHSSLIKGNKKKFAVDMDLCIQLNEKECRDENDSEVKNKYDIAFYENKNVSPTLFRIKDAFRQAFRDRSKREEEIENTLKKIPTASREYARTILNKLCEKIYDDPKIIQFQEVSDDEDAALDMFVRFNNGGARLTKSEIGEAMIEAIWPNANKSLSQVCYYKRNKWYEKKLDRSLESYHEFGLDFIIRLSKVLFENKSNTSINTILVRQMCRNWERIKAALRETEKFLFDIRKIRVKEYSKRWNILIPIIYIIYNHINPDDGDTYTFDQGYRSQRRAIEAYISRAVLFKYYGSGTPGKLATLKNKIEDYKIDGRPCLTLQILDGIQDLRATDEKIDNLLELKKGDVVCEWALRLISSERIHRELSFNRELEYDVDHIHSRKRFEGHAPEGVQDDLWEEWGKLCEEMPNLSMLNSDENRTVKNDLPLKEYIQQKSPTGQSDYKRDHFIPDVDLELSNFGTFFESRKKMLRAELEKLLHKGESDEGFKNNPPTAGKNDYDCGNVHDVQADDGQCPKKNFNYGNIQDLTDQQVEELGNIDRIEEEIKEYEDSQGEDEQWLDPKLHEIDNPIFRLANKDRDRLENGDLDELEDDFDELDDEDLDELEEDIDERVKKILDKYKKDGPRISIPKMFYTDERDNEPYRSIRIGNQVWMTENLRFAIDDSYECHEDKILFNRLNRVGECGRLYARSSIIQAVPEGWRIPEKRDFEELLKSVSNDVDALKKLKFWPEWAFEKNPNKKTCGFDAVPEGYFDMDRQTYDGFYESCFWVLDSSTDDQGNKKYSYFRIKGETATFKEMDNLSLCFSIRCIKK